MQAFFNGLSGLFAFSKGLDNVSNNVSNMNTPGYRGTSTFYRSISNSDGAGYGAEVAGTDVRETPGTLQQTGNDTDLAINGAGYFVLRDSQGNNFYTRAGQFKLDKDGNLIDSVSQYNVQGIDASGSLAGINIKDQRTLPPTPTSKITMVGSLARSGPTDPSQTITGVKVFDKTGVQHTLQIKLTPQDTPANSWAVAITDETELSVGSGTVTFGVDGSPVANSTIAFTLTTNGASQTISLDFGQPGDFNKAYQVSSAATNTLAAQVTDGSAVAGLTGFTFDSSGTVKFTYSNGEKRDGGQLALADFPDATALVTSEKALYKAPADLKPTIGHPAQGQFGQIQADYIELSNVDLSQEFGDILIIQRGYQASSRVMTVSNEMLEQLYNSTHGG